MRGKQDSLPGTPDGHDCELAQGYVEECGHGRDGLENATLACKGDEMGAGTCNGDVCLVGGGDPEMMYERDNIWVFFKQSKKAVDSAAGGKADRNMGKAGEADGVVPAAGQQQPGAILSL